MKKGWKIGLIIGGAILALTAISVTISLVAKNVNQVTETYELDKSFNKIKVDVDTSDVEFIKVNEGYGKVICKESKEHKHTVKIEDDTLKIEFDHKYVIHFGFASPDYKVQVYIPTTNEYDLDAVHTTGDFRIASDFTFTNIKVKGATGDNIISSNVKNSLNISCSTGKISISNMNPTSIYIESSTGDAYLKDINCIGNINMKSTTGKKQFDNVKAQNLTLDSSTGASRLDKVTLVSKLSISASTGDVRISQSDAAEIDIKLTTGDVRAEFLTSKIVYAKSITGRVDVPKSTTGGLCSIETSTGDIKVTFAK